MGRRESGPGASPAVDAEGAFHRVEHVVGSGELLALEEEVGRGLVELRHLTIQVDAELATSLLDEGQMVGGAFGPARPVDLGSAHLSEAGFPVVGRFRRLQRHHGDDQLPVEPMVHHIALNVRWDLPTVQVDVGLDVRLVEGKERKCLRRCRVHHEIFAEDPSELHEMQEEPLQLELVAAHAHGDHRLRCPRYPAHELHHGRATRDQVCSRTLAALRYRHGLVIPPG